jgi:hypothetical protein
VCGGTDVVPPFIVTLAVGADIADALRAANPAYVAEVQEAQFDWHAVELLDWTKLAKGPCLND